MTTVVVIKNKKAYFDFEVLDTIEAGIILSGAEVKSIREGKANLKGSHVSIGRTAVTENVHVSPYQPKNQPDYSPTRRRTLLLHRDQLSLLHEKQHEQGVTIVPLEMYIKGGLVKMLIGICRGRKKHDKREVLKKRTVERNIARLVKR